MTARESPVPKRDSPLERAAMRLALCLPTTSGAWQRFLRAAARHAERKAKRKGK